MNNATVAHNFANRTGRVKNGNNLFYEFRDSIAIIYSYGSHFSIAASFPETIEGSVNCLMTLQSYSNSTAKHKNHVLNAISHLNVLSVPSLAREYVAYDNEYVISANDSLAKKDLEYFNKELRSLSDKQIRARKYDYTDEIQMNIDNAKKYCQFFNKKHLLSGDLRKIIYEELSISEAMIILCGEEYKKALESKKEAQRKKQFEELAKWKKFETSYLSAHKFTYLRYNKETITIETSKSVKVTELERAKNLYRLCKVAKQKGERIDIKGFYNDTAFNFNGFKVDKIESNGSIFAGCHIIPFSEVLEIGKALSFDL